MQNCCIASHLRHCEFTKQSSLNTFACCCIGIAMIFSRLLDCFAHLAFALMSVLSGARNDVAFSAFFCFLFLLVVLKVSPKGEGFNPFLQTLNRTRKPMACFSPLDCHAHLAFALTSVQSSARNDERLTWSRSDIL